MQHQIRTRAKTHSLSQRSHSNWHSVISIISSQYIRSVCARSKHQPQHIHTQNPQHRFPHQTKRHCVAAFVLIFSEGPPKRQVGARNRVFTMHTHTHTREHEHENTYKHSRCGPSSSVCVYVTIGVCECMRACCCKSRVVHAIRYPRRVHAAPASTATATTKNTLAWSQFANKIIDSLRVLLSVVPLRDCVCVCSGECDSVLMTT